MMSPAGTRSRGGALVIAVIVVVVIAAAIALFSLNGSKQRTAQQNDFRKDLAAMGFEAPKPAWDDEIKTSGRKRKPGKTVSVLEAVVTVNGCQVELERKKGEDNLRRAELPMNLRGMGHKIEVYTLDEGRNGQGGEIEIKGFTTMAPTPAEVAEYLKGHSSLFGHCYKP